MKKIGLIFVLLPLYAFHPGKKVLSDFPAYQEESYYKETVYAEHDWKEFYQLKEPNQTVEPGHYDLHLLNAALFFATNKIREEKKRKPLQYLKGLRDAAILHTHEMTTLRFFAHENPYNKKFYSPEMRMQLFGVKSEYTGENCDMQFPDEEETYIQLAEDIVKDLYDSPGHRVNMLNIGFRYMGCAAEITTGKEEGDYTIRATQDFCGK